MRKEMKQRFEKRGFSDFVEGTWEEVSLVLNGDLGIVNFSQGCIHKDGTVTSYDGFCYPGCESGWGFNSVVCSAEKARDIYQYNIQKLSLYFSQ